MPKDARAFGQDLMRGEHKIGEASTGGVLYDAPSAADPAFYQKKRAAEAKVGRELTTAEFLRDHYVAPDGSTVASSGTSIFDPTLTELLYRWFSPPGGLILDPFAGGSVRGVVASKLGRRYLGVELRKEQVEANRAQAEEICAAEEHQPVWHHGDSTNLDKIAADVEADFVFSCPPYADLEIYSDDPRDLSTMEYPAFRSAYAEIIRKACDRLKEHRFAAFVVGDARGPDGNYYGIPYDTIAAFRAAGLHLYNEAVLVTPVGSLPIRVGRQFATTRKLGKTHQNVLIFLKGDAKRATTACGPVEMGDPGDAGGDAETGDAPEEPRPATPPAGGDPDFMPALTPVERRGDVWVKRDDLFAVAGVRGGKVRSCWHLSQGAPGLVTAGSRASPQVNIVAHIAKRLGIPCRVHTPTGDLSPEVREAKSLGAEVIQHKAGYNNVIIARAREDAARLGWRDIPFGMECHEAVRQTQGQVDNIPDDAKRLVVPVGSGMSLAGILTGLCRIGRSLPVLGVIVGADPRKRLARYAPAGWRKMVTLVPSGLDYHDEAPRQSIAGLSLDPIYEAKCIPFLEPGDVLWVVGIRATAS
jgi:hypothetical protein